MCNPGFLALGAAAVSAVGQIQGGLYARQMARYQAQNAEQNKQLAREGAVDAIVQGQEQQRQLGRDIAARVGAQTARMSANNVDPTMGSAARVIDDTRMIGAEDSVALSENYRRRVKGLQIDVRNYESEKRAAKSEGRQAMIGAAFGATTTLLGGAQQYSDFKRKNP